MNRRDFLCTVGVTLGSSAVTSWPALGEAGEEPPRRPNILWISTEDISPDVGCYGDAYAITPNLDRLAAQGIRYEHAYAHMGVCAPARSGIITGMYPTSIGTNHMRCQGVPQPGVHCFTEDLRVAGYYCTNRSKTDYQFGSPMTAWDVCGAKGHWRQRGERQPFFCVINMGITHEGQIRNAKRRAQIASSLSRDERHDPAKASLPPYYPDTPAVRQDWAQYADLITLMDRDVAKILADLETDGLAEDTIVWFWGDHGRGLPRGKRWIYDSGLRFPLLIRVPERYRAWAFPGAPERADPGTVDTDLISFVDFAPTMLSLAGIPIPGYMQGQVFMGPQKARPREYVYAARDRVDEAYDMIRAVRGKRFKYIRNFMPHLPRSLDIEFMDRMPTMQEMRRLHAEGRLNGAELQYFEPGKPVEELYDTVVDPHEVRNLAAVPAHHATLVEMRRSLFDWMLEVGDFGVFPECEFDALKRPGDIYEVTGAPGASGNAAGSGRVRVTLESSTPGAGIAFRASARGGDESGVSLSAMKAKKHGDGAKQGRGKIYAWRDRGTWFSWEVHLEKAGRIPVHVHQAYARNDPGRRYTVTVGEKSLVGTVRRTTGWDDFEYVRLGDIDVPTPGVYPVSIRPESGDTPYSMDLRAVILGDENVEKRTAPGEWQVYSGPVEMLSGQVIDVQAYRLGFRDSSVVQYTVGGENLAVQAAEQREHWRTTIDASGAVKRVLALKAVEHDSELFLRRCRETLLGEHDGVDRAVRYWAVVGLHRGAAVAERARFVPVFRGLLQDPGPAVRVAAAQALCDWGYAEEGLTVLRRELLENELGSGRLLAATAMNQIGPVARPALDEIRAGLKDKQGYVKRMCAHTLRALGELPGKG